MNTMVKRTVSILLAAFVIAAIAAAVMSENSYAAIKLSKKSIVIGKGQSVKLKVKGTRKKVKWSSTKKSVATVTKKGVVKGKKIGSCYIKAKVAGKTLKCKVTVKKPAVANAMNLRKYILSHGRPDKWDGKAGYAIGWTYGSEGDPYHKVARVCAYKDTTRMYFELYDQRDDMWARVQMRIDLCKEKTGSIYFYEDAESYDEGDFDSVTADIDKAYDGTLDTLKNVSVGNNVYGTDSAKSSAVKEFNEAFSDFDKVFKKAKLSSTMKKIGFSKWSA